MGIIVRDLDDHEGYAARRLPDGTLTDFWTAATAAFTGYLPACDCGWTGAVEYPPDDDGCVAAEDAWYVEHATPLLVRAIPADIRALLDELKRATDWLAAERPLAAPAIVAETRAWAERLQAGARLNRLTWPEPPTLGL